MPIPPADPCEVADLGLCEFPPSILAKSLSVYEEAVVELDSVKRLAFILFDLDRALSSLLWCPSLFALADIAPICNLGNAPLANGFGTSCGTALLPIGVARLSLGNDGLDMSSRGRDG